jgi:hypothetical protein
MAGIYGTRAKCSPYPVTVPSLGAGREPGAPGRAEKIAEAMTDFVGYGSTQSNCYVGDCIHCEVNPINPRALTSHSLSII